MIETITLENGLKIAMEPIPFVRSIAFGIYVRNGSRNESSENNGISHFIEHMLFKGTKNRTAKQIADEFDSIGGQLNAYTAKEMTCYYARVLDSHFDRALDVLADMFFNSTFMEEDIEKERNVIIEEIGMSEDAPEDVVVDLLQYNMFKNDPLGFPVLGGQKIIETFTQKTFQDYFRKNYRPENTVIALAGNFKPEDMINRIEKYFSAFQVSEPYTASIHNTISTPSFAIKEKDLEQLHLCLAFPGIPLDSKNLYAMTAFNAMFGSGMSSRLFQNIREKHGLVYSIYSYNAAYVDVGTFTIYAAMNANHAKKAISLILEEINSLYSDRITDEYLNRTKEQIKSNLLLSMENSSSRMSSLGRSKLLLNRILTMDELIERVDMVNIDQLYQLIDSIFQMGKLSGSAVGKIKGFEWEELISNAR